MRTPPHKPAKHLVVMIMFEPTRFAPDYLQAAYTALVAPGRRPSRPTPECRQHPNLVPNLGGGGSDASASRGPVRAGLVRATG